MAFVSGISPAILFVILFVLILAASAIKILREYERGVVFRIWHERSPGTGDL